MWVFSEADDNIRYVNKVEEKLIEEEEVERNGELLFCGGTSWDTLSNYGHPNNTHGNLISPTRLTPLIGVNIRFVAAGCASSHCVALDVEGRVYTWGKNKRGQLGHGDMIQRDRPTIVSGLSEHKIIKAGAGRAHTVVVTNDGKSFAFGWNKHGQCGTGSTRTEFQQSPVSTKFLKSQMLFVEVILLCGCHLWRDHPYCLPQYGQLGHGTDNEYNTKSSAVNLAYEAQPHPKAIAAFAGGKIVKVACGTNHTVAVDSEGVVYTWGYGAYGRLGHREPKDEWTPRVVALFQKKNALLPNAIVAAGAHNCAVTAGGGQLYMWGKLKVTGEDWMYPKPLLTLSGWNIRCMDSSATLYLVGAEKSCISWGNAQYGELGYGPKGPKSATNPKKVDVLEGMHVMSLMFMMVKLLKKGLLTPRLKVLHQRKVVLKLHPKGTSLKIRQSLLNPRLFLLHQRKAALKLHPVKGRSLQVRQSLQMKRMGVTVVAAKMDQMTMRTVMWKKENVVVVKEEGVMVQSHPQLEKPPDVGEDALLLQKRKACNRPGDELVEREAGRESHEAPLLPSPKFCIFS